MIRRIRNLIHACTGARRAKLALTTWRLNPIRDVDCEYLRFSMQVARDAPLPCWKFDSTFLSKTETVRQLARQSMEELFTLYYTTLLTQGLEGDLAIVGTYRGGDALLVARTKSPKTPLHLFDRFEQGMPSSSAACDAEVPPGTHRSSLSDLQYLLKDFENICIYPGLFPTTGEPVKEKIFKWVHLDVDLYESTKLALSFFADRMSRRGVILCHDYWNLPGVKAACDEFIASGDDYLLLPLGGSHCALVRSF